MEMNRRDEAKQREKPIGQSASPETEPPQAQTGESRPADPESAYDLLTHKAGEGKSKAVQAADAAVLAESRHRTRCAFLVGGAFAAAAYGFYRWLDYGPHDNMLPTLVDRTYDVNADLSRTAFRDHALAPTYPLSRAETLRVNGVYGLKKELQLDSCRLQIVGAKMRNTTQDTSPMSPPGNIGTEARAMKIRVTTPR